MVQKKSRGGKRIGAGRKALDEKKQPLFIYVQESHIENVGGKHKAKLIAEGAIIRRSKAILK